VTRFRLDKKENGHLLAWVETLINAFKYQHENLRKFDLKVFSDFTNMNDV